jgi:hypothetical protein
MKTHSVLISGIDEVIVHEAEFIGITNDFRSARVASLERRRGIPSQRPDSSSSGHFVTFEKRYSMLNCMCTTGS